MKISIIIPCYNSERFIANTLNMLISQDLDDCEVIVVNDGSTDETSNIVHLYSENNSSIKIIDKKNEGVSVARNTGLNMARGKYICFLDSDDMLTEGTLNFYRKILAENSGEDFFAFGYYSQYKNRILKDYSIKKYDGITFDALQLKQSFFSKKLCFHICSCIYKKSFLEEYNITFTPGIRIGEDVEFLLKVLQYAQNCLYNARHCFIYQIRDDSTMQGYVYSENMMTGFLHIKTCAEKYKVKSLNKYVNFFIFYNYISNFICYLRSNKKSELFNNFFLDNKNLIYKHMPFITIITACEIMVIRIIPFRLIFFIRKHV